MILDARTEFANLANISQAGAGTTVFGDVIDLEDLRDIGNGRELFWYVITGPVAGADGTSVNFQLTSADNDALSSNPVVHLQTGVIGVANLTANTRLIMAALPLELPSWKRYVGVRQVVAGTFSAGNARSGLTLDPQGWRAYADGRTFK